MLVALRLGSGLLHCASLAIAAQTYHQSRVESYHKDITSTPANPPVCDARTINHITHTLPQLCLARARQTGSLNPTDVSPPPVSTSGDYPYARTEDPIGSVTYTSTIEVATEGDAPGSGETATTRTVANTTASPDDAAHASDTASSRKCEMEEDFSHVSSSTPVIDIEHDGHTEGSSYMSFEDWKEKMLRQTGQDPQALRSRKAAGSYGERRTPPLVGDYGLGEEDEISLDFGDYLNEAGRSSHEIDDQNLRADKEDALLYAGDQAPLHRSKDAGKTCKERFSYASFDAGATILKTGRSTKNAKAILIENKDSYMLLECGADSKYVIVELSDDILIDTVVLANFEFFSSMIRQFRVSVSDRYPVKVEKWREIGTYEARNSRDIQAFLVENPQIWAKYVRVEFLSHYGNEFYCPVSLLRIHGSRILDSLKDMDGPREEDISIGEEEPPAAEDPADEITPAVETGGDVITENGPSAPGKSFTPWVSSPLVQADSTCDATLEMEDTSPRPGEKETTGDDGSEPYQLDKIKEVPVGLLKPKTQSTQTDVDYLPPAKTSTTAPAGETRETRSTPACDSKHTSSALNTTAPTDGVSSTVKVNPTSSTHKLRGTGSSGAPAAAPTVQEGFFQTISKRLHQAEANLTLTMQYLEDHSKFVQESLEKAEQKQLSKITAFLHNLNQTVLTELLGIRDQYDQIWQSTVIALETQKEQSDRDIVALSARLNLLADEVVFQKRMAIVQAVLLLCCLFLVIFSRGVPIPYLAPLLEQNGTGTLPAALHGQPHSQPLFTTQSHEDIFTSQDEGWSRGSRHTYMHPGPIEKHEEGEAVSSSSHGDAGSSTNLCQPPRLSPLLVSNLEASDSVSSATDLTISANTGELDNTVGRRSTFHVHGVQRPKPLPALPEHPSPDGHPTECGIEACE